MAPKTPRSGTRTSSRLAAKSSPDSAQSSKETKNMDAENNDDSDKKRKADAATSPSDRPEKKSKADQKTLEETLNIADDQVSGSAEIKSEEQQPVSKEPSKAEASKSEDDQAKTEPTTNGEQEEKAEESKPSTANGAIEESSQREKAIPSSILEKGIYYFFARPRVDIEDPKSIQDIARSYIVLRPLPLGAKLGDGPLEDHKNLRLVALPKKTLPKSHSDRFMAFVEKAGVSVDTLKEQFMAGNTYQTQSGERHSPPVKPIGEGVYAITSTGRESHLAYMLAIPNELSEVQKDLGLNEKGSFVLSTKNPESKGPSIAQFDNPAEFSKEIMDDFHGRSWMPLQPSHLDYANAQLLLIGEGRGELGKAAQELEKDENDDEKKAPEDEMELLQDEELSRVQALKGDDTIFDDLGASKKDYPKVQTTW